MSNRTTGFAVDANVNPFEASMRRMVNAAKQSEGGVNNALASMGGPLAGLQKAVTAAVGAFAALGGIRALVNLSDQSSLTAARLSIVTGSTEAATAAQRELFNVAQRMQVPFAELQSTFARIMPSVREL